MRVIHEQGQHRIIELIDEVTTFQDLIGDSYNPDANPDIKRETLASELKGQIK